MNAQANLGLEARAGCFNRLLQQYCFDIEPFGSCFNKPEGLAKTVSLIRLLVFDGGLQKLYNLLSGPNLLKRKYQWFIELYMFVNRCYTCNFNAKKGLRLCLALSFEKLNNRSRNHSNRSA